MVNENKFAEIKLVPSTPKTYEVRYLENESKQSKLSLTARSKVINKSGSNYLSPWADTDLGEAIGYGPTGETKKVEVAKNRGCSNPAEYTVATILKEDYYFSNESGKAFYPFLYVTGKVKDKGFGEIQKRINDLKSGKIRIFKGDSKSFERTEKCIKYEGYFEAKLEEAVETLENGRHYGESYAYYITRP